MCSPHVTLRTRDNCPQSGLVSLELSPPAPALRYGMVLSAHREAAAVPVTRHTAPSSPKYFTLSLLARLHTATKLAKGLPIISGGGHTDRATNHLVFSVYSCPISLLNARRSRYAFLYILYFNPAEKQYFNAAV